LSRFRGSGVCRQPVPPGMPVVGAQSPALNPIQSRKLQRIAADCSSWASLTRRLAARDATDKEIWRGPTERLSPQPVYAAYLDVVGGDPRFAACQRAGIGLSDRLSQCRVNDRERSLSAARDWSCFGAGGHRTFEMGYARTENHTTTMHALYQVVKSRDARI